MNECNKWSSAFRVIGIFIPCDWHFSHGEKWRNCENIPQKTWRNCENRPLKTWRNCEKCIEILRRNCENIIENSTRNCEEVCFYEDARS